MQSNRCINRITFPYSLVPAIAWTRRFTQHIVWQNILLLLLLLLRTLTLTLYIVAKSLHTRLDCPGFLACLGCRPNPQTNARAAAALV